MLSLKRLLDQVAKNEGFSDYEVKTNNGSNHGDNYVGIMTSITISGTKGLNAAREELHLICKTSPEDDSRKKLLKSNLVFNREIFAYTKLLPAFARFQQEQGLSEAESFLSYPKVYASEANEKIDNYVLIMEDMRHKNYEMWPREKVIDLGHELCVMSELGKFHGVSFALKDQRPAEFEEFKKLNDLFIEAFVNGLFGPYIKKSIERAANALENPEYKKYMLNLRKNYTTKVTDYLSESFCKEFGVIGHGDCWNNNFLFQYSDDDVSVSVTRINITICLLSTVFIYAENAIDVHLFVGLASLTILFAGG